VRARDDRRAERVFGGIAARVAEVGGGHAGSARAARAKLGLPRAHRGGRTAIGARRTAGGPAVITGRSAVARRWRHARPRPRGGARSIRTGVASARGRTMVGRRGSVGGPRARSLRASENRDEPDEAPAAQAAPRQFHNEKAYVPPASSP
jgi:hypothetical protein